MKERMNHTRRHRLFGHSMILMLALLIAAGLMHAPLSVKADAVEQDEFMDDYQESVKYSKKIGVWVFRDSYVLNMGSKVKNARKVTVKSSNKKKVSVSVIRKGKNKNHILLKPLKTGKSTVTVTVTGKNGKKKTFKSNITVYKYTNSLKQMKIGREKYIFSSSDTYVFDYAGLTVSDETESVMAKISVKPKSGWKLAGIKRDSKAIKNNSKLKFTIDDPGDELFTVKLYNKKKNLTATFFFEYEGASSTAG